MSYKELQNSLEKQGFTPGAIHDLKKYMKAIRGHGIKTYVKTSEGFYAWVNPRYLTENVRADSGMRVTIDYLFNSPYLIHVTLLDKVNHITP